MDFVFVGLMRNGIYVLGKTVSQLVTKDTVALSNVIRGVEMQDERGGFHLRLLNDPFFTVEETTTLNVSEMVMHQLAGPGSKAHKSYDDFLTSVRAKRSGLFTGPKVGEEMDNIKRLIKE